MIKINNIRNIGIIAHIDAGKTTLSERILYYTGKIHKMGEVHHGDASMDWMVQEQERGITITSAVTTCHWKNHEINLIDTPGHVDFTIEVERSLRVLDGAIVVFSAVDGVEAQSETVWKQADKYKIPKIAFINKMDRIGADYFKTVDMMKKRFSSVPLIIQIPYIEKDGIFKGIIDILDKKIIIWNEKTLGVKFDLLKLSNNLISNVSFLREQIIEILAEYNDDIATKYLNNEIITTDNIINIIRELTLKLKIVPILCGSVLKNKGVQPLLDAIIQFLPSPIDISSIEDAINPKTGNTIKRYSRLNQPFCALAFKVIIEDGRKITYLRLYSGQIKNGQEIFNIIKKKKEKISHLLKIHANKRERITKAVAGNIVAVIGLKFTNTGDTLCEENHPIILENISLYEPVITQAIEAKSLSEQEKLIDALHKLSEEDPTLKVKYNQETTQMTIAGMGELHLEIIIDRLIREFKIYVNIGKPRVVYRETISKVTKTEAKFDQNIGENKHFGHIFLQIEPQKRGYGFNIENNINYKEIPFEFHESILNSIYEIVNNGIHSGYPITDCKVILLGGSFINGESSTIGYKIATSIAFKKAYLDAKPILLEPIMQVDIVTPSIFLNNIISDINSKHGIVEKITNNGIVCEIQAKISLKRLFGYSTDLRSLSQGRAIFNMKFLEFNNI